MPAYLIGDTSEVMDPDTLAKYGAAAGPTVQKHGGRVVVAGPGETIEGDWRPGRLIVIEFPDMAALKGWYDSPEYQEIVGLRLAAARTNVVAVESA